MTPDSILDHIDCSVTSVLFPLGLTGPVVGAGLAMEWCAADQQERELCAAIHDGHGGLVPPAQMDTARSRVEHAHAQLSRLTDILNELGLRKTISRPTALTCGGKKLVVPRPADHLYIYGVKVKLTNQMQALVELLSKNLGKRFHEGSVQEVVYSRVPQRKNGTPLTVAQLRYKLVKRCRDALTQADAYEILDEVDRIFDNRNGICLNLSPDEVSVAA